MLRSVDLHVVALRWQDRSWLLTLNDHMQVRVDDASRIMKLLRFAELYPELKQQERPIERVDLRYEKGLAVKWRIPVATANGMKKAMTSQGIENGNLSEKEI